MRRLASRPVPRALVVAVLLAAVVAFALVGAWRFRQARRAEDAAAAEARGAGAPASIPLWRERERVEHASRFVFSHDPVEVLRPLREEEGLDRIVEGAASHEDACRRLMRWTRAQFEPGRPDPYPPPDARTTLREIRAGRTGGFCAQYCFVLVQAIRSLGPPARCVTIRDHEVIEAWLPDEGRWTMLDPTLELQVLDESGTSLSALAIHEAAAGGAAVQLSAGHRLDGDRLAYLRRFERFGVWTRNDLVTRPMNYEDFARYRAWYVPSGEAPTGPSDSLRTRFAGDLYP